MRITKYIHSCVLLEKNGDRLLFDPGHFTFVEGLVSPERFRDVDTIVITHDHPDHLDPDALRRILELSGARVVTNGEVAADLAKQGIDATTVEDGELTAGAFTLRAVPARHEAILSATLPRSAAFLVDGRVLNTSDSFDVSLWPLAGTEILIVPVMAPFLTERTAATFIRSMRPRHVIPVHDGYARDFFRPQRYAAFESFLTDADITFHRLMDPGDSVEL